MFSWPSTECDPSALSATVSSGACAERSGLESGVLVRIGLLLRLPAQAKPCTCEVAMLTVASIVVGNCKPMSNINLLKTSAVVFYLAAFYSLAGAIVGVVVFRDLSGSAIPQAQRWASFSRCDGTRCVRPSLLRAPNASTDAPSLPSPPSLRPPPSASAARAACPPGPAAAPRGWAVRGRSARRSRCGRRCAARRRSRWAAG